MNIAEVICTAGRAGFFNRDLAAVKAGAQADGFAYPGRPVSPGFTHIVQPGTAISVMLLLDDGQVAFGDCMDVILSGVAGRDPLFRADDHLDFLRTAMRERLCGRRWARGYAAGRSTGSARSPRRSTAPSTRVGHFIPRCATASPRPCCTPP